MITFAQILFVTVAAAAAFWLSALPGFNMSHLSSGNASAMEEAKWEADFIRSHVHFRLLQPEWFHGQPSPSFHWMVAESALRLGLVAVIWSGSVAFILRHQIKLASLKLAGRQLIKQSDCSE